MERKGERHSEEVQEQEGVVASDTVQTHVFLSQLLPNTQRWKRGGLTKEWCLQTEVRRAKGEVSGCFKGFAYLTESDSIRS